MSQADSSPSGITPGRLIVGGMLATATGMGIGRFFYTPMLPLMQREAGFGADVAGLIASVNFAGYLAGSMIAAMVPKGRPRLWAFRVGLVASIATTFAMGLTHALAVWLVLRVLSGVSSAFVFLFGATMIAEALSEIGQEARVGWLFGGVGCGIAASGLLVRIAGSGFDWAGLWMLAGGLSALFIPFILVTVKDVHFAAHKHPRRVARRVPRPLPLWALFFNYGLEGLGYSVLATFIVAIVKSRPGMEAIGDWVWVIIGLTGLPSCIAWAWLAERIGFAAALAAAYVTQIVAIVLPAVSASAPAALVCAILFGGTFMAITALIVAVGRQGAKGRGFAVLTTGFGAGQILGPLLTGLFVRGPADYNAALLASAGVVFLGLLFLGVAVAETRGRARELSAR